MITKSGTLSIMPEYNKKCKTGFIIGMPPPEIMGGVLRESGSKAIVVSLDKRSGGARYSLFFIIFLFIFYLLIHGIVTKNLKDLQKNKAKHVYLYLDQYRSFGMILL